MDSRSEFVSLLADAASAELVIPLACPMEIADGRYLLEELIDAGRRAWVYRAIDRRLSSRSFDATVIVKIFKAIKSDEHESLLARRVEHPNIIGVIDRGRTQDGHPFLVMAYARGGDLGRVDVPMAPRKAAEVIALIAEAVHRLHVSGIVHCDIKPANILLSESGEPLLADFELAASPITDSVSFRGTLAFMSPEQRGADPDALGPLTDVYGLGAVLHYLLTGRPPDSGSAVATDLGKIPRALVSVCQRAIAFDRNDRHASAAEFAGNLRAWLQARPIEWQRPGMIRRLSLWSRRHPAKAVAAGAASMAIFGMTVGLFVWRQEATRRELTAQARALELANAKIDNLQAQGRTQIRAIFDMLGLRNRSASEDMLPVLVWLDWLGSSQLVAQDGTLLAAQERIGALEKRLVLVDQTHPGSVESLVLRIAIAELEMRDRRSESAISRIREIRTLWQDRLEPGDPLRVTLQAIETCALVDTGAINGADAIRQLQETLGKDGLRDRLRDAVERRLKRLISSDPATDAPVR